MFTRHVDYLELEIRRLREEVRHERMRAEEAIDRLLHRENIAVISPTVTGREQLEDMPASEPAREPVEDIAFREAMPFIGGRMPSKKKSEE